MRRTPSGIKMDPTLPMTYDSSNSALKNLGKGLGYEEPIQHYNFKRWAANEVNYKRPFLALYVTIHHYCALLQQ
jgi:hypothetical protein